MFAYRQNRVYWLLIQPVVVVCNLILDLAPSCLSPRPSVDSFWLHSRQTHIHTGLLINLAFLRLDLFRK